MDPIRLQEKVRFPNLHVTLFGLMRKLEHSFAMVKVFVMRLDDQFKNSAKFYGSCFNSQQISRPLIKNDFELDGRTRFVFFFKHLSHIVLRNYIII